MDDCIQIVVKRQWNVDDVVLIAIGKADKNGSGQRRWMIV